MRFVITFLTSLERRVEREVFAPSWEQALGRGLVAFVDQVVDSNGEHITKLAPLAAA